MPVDAVLNCVSVEILSLIKVKMKTDIRLFLDHFRLETVLNGILVDGHLLGHHSNLSRSDHTLVTIRPETRPGRVLEQQEMLGE